MIDDELQAYFLWLEQDEIRMRQWLRQVAEEKTDWSPLLSDPTAWDIN